MFTSNYTIGGPYYRTVGGEFELSDSPYGTFDQGGNVMEWNETDIGIPSTSRGVRGGAYLNTSFALHASNRSREDPSNEASALVGFRVARIPDPNGLGDYNHDGTVDAADYTVWRDQLGSATSLPNDDSQGVDTDDYDRWKSAFGETAGAGGHALGNTPVPEPSVALLFTLAATGLSLCRGRPTI